MHKVKKLFSYTSELDKNPFGLRREIYESFEEIAYLINTHLKKDYNGKQREFYMKLLEIDRHLAKKARQETYRIKSLDDFYSMVNFIHANFVPDDQ
ncbi:MAG: hypothetical protein R3A45_04810 [Bdellovibrionota bacterium]